MASLTGDEVTKAAVPGTLFTEAAAQSPGFSLSLWVYESILVIPRGPRREVAIGKYKHTQAGLSSHAGWGAAAWSGRRLVLGSWGWRIWRVRIYSI